MCGIVAHIGGRDCVPILLEGLARLEYRGYDSAGIAVLSRAGESPAHKTKGRVAHLAAALPARLKGSPGIAHTRRAAPVVPRSVSRHPHAGDVAAVRADGLVPSSLDGRTTIKEPSTIDTEAAAYDAEGYTHFMRKEIHEQPRAVERTLSGRLDSRFHTAHLGGLNLDARQLREIRRVLVLGSGSAS